MNYELAKKLKDAGFPQPEKYEAYNPDTGLWEYDAQLKGILPYAPTLSELIEACGKNLNRLNRIEINYGRVSMWEAGKNPEIIFRGKTPEEAVANLWLELNKKNA